METLDVDILQLAMSIFSFNLICQTGGYPSQWTPHCELSSSPSALLSFNMLSFAVTRNQDHHGGHQEENAGHEGGEGQPDGPLWRLWAGWRPQSVRKYFQNISLIQSCRDAKLKREKTEEEVNELQNKAKTLEVRTVLWCEIVGTAR